MKEQHTECYEASYYSEVIAMQEDINSHVKRGWYVKCMCNTASDVVVVVYEKEVVVENIENIEEKIKV